ncbi:MAG: hypothetical protein JWR69_3602, partial [Pedosphaera sp.]|nr:hypothetical protein [Pedosphaera sp.]
SDVDAAYRLGANSFLVKPNGQNQLRDLVKVLRAYCMTLNKAPLKCVEAGMNRSDGLHFRAL